jgi:multisubunit Na+/H+ antiporter MnhE subunit
MSKVTSFLILTIFGLVFWFLISGYDTQILLFGLAVSLATSGIVLVLMHSEKSYKIKLTKLLFLPPWYLYEILKAIVYMIYFIFTKKIQPNIKEVKLRTKSKTIHDCIAFSITNLPGSVAISNGNKSLTSHSIVFDQSYIDCIKKFESYYMKMLGVRE